MSSLQQIFRFPLESSSVLCPSIVVTGEETSIAMTGEGTSIAMTGERTSIVMTGKEHQLQ
jgi:hypothetical protein